MQRGYKGKPCVPKASSRARFVDGATWNTSHAPRPRAALTSFAHVAVSNSVFTTKPKGYPTKNGAVAGSRRACLGIHPPADRPRVGTRSTNCVGYRRRFPGARGPLRPAAAVTEGREKDPLCPRNQEVRPRKRRSLVLTPRSASGPTLLPTSYRRPPSALRTRAVP